MILVVVLFWLDTYYQNLLFGPILRSIYLEMFKLNRGLSTYVSRIHRGLGMSTIILQFLYYGFIAGLFLLGVFTSGLVTITNDDSTQNDNTVNNQEEQVLRQKNILVSLLFIILVLSLMTMLIIYSYGSRRRVKCYDSLLRIFLKIKLGNPSPSEVEALEQGVLAFLASSSTSIDDE